MASYLYTQPAPAPPAGLTRRQGGSSAGKDASGYETRLGGFVNWDQDALSAGSSDGDEARRDDADLTLTGVHPDAYASCFVCTVRGLYDRRVGTIIMAWTWVALVIWLNVSIIWTLHEYINRDSAVQYGSRSAVTKVIERLQDSMFNNTALNTTKKMDRLIVELCEKQPSEVFFFVVHFIWSARMLGQLSQARTMLYCMYACPVRDVRHHTIEERDDNIVITGLMPFDCCIFTTALVLPKTLVAVLLWYVGTELLALTRDLGHLLLKAVTLYYISIIEQEVFNNFLAHSKKEWIMNCQVVQVHGKYFGIAVSWPGEVLKLLSAVSLVFASKQIFGIESQVRSLCYQCVHTCPLECSQAFNYCRKLPSWPFNYKGLGS